jgi:outer membrane biosynthesis protein TonB
MSENQKVVISVLGAVVGHLLLFFLLALLFHVAAVMAPQNGHAATPKAPAPEEVTILLADLMKQIDVVPKELSQQYMRTDPDQESREKPENAPFHSDRNTRLTSPLPPDPKSDLQAPTVKGRTDLPFFEIRDREFVDGEFLDKSAVSALSSAASAAQASPAMTAQPALALNDPSAAKPTPIRDPSEQPTEQKLDTKAAPSDQPKEAPEANPINPADADTTPDKAAKTETQPEAVKITDTATMAQRQESFDTPFAADPVAKARPAPDLDREAEAKKKTPDTGEAAAPESAMPASALPVARPFLPSPPVPPSPNPATAQTANASSAANSPNLPPNPKPPSDSPAFTPQTRAREMQGGADNIGRNPSFDVEASALGKYKKLVTQAVERQWHRYREKNADFVTYGNLKVKFRVDKEGTPRSLKIVKNDSNAVMAEFTLRAVLDADIPPMPADVAGMLGSSGLEITYDVIIY